MESPIFPLSNGHGSCDFAGLVFSLGFSYAFLGIVRFTSAPERSTRAAVPRFWGARVFDFCSLGGVAACCYFLLQSSSIFKPTWPHLGPQVGPYKPIFCPSFSDQLSISISDLILERFRTPHRCQNRSKINQKILPKSTYKPVLFQLHLQSNFEDNLMFKQNGRFSKIGPKPNVFAGFLDIRSCQPKQTRDMQRIEKSPKTMSKNQLFFYRNSIYFRLFLAPFSKSEI